MKQSHPTRKHIHKSKENSDLNSYDTPPLTNNIIQIKNANLSNNALDTGQKNQRMFNPNVSAKSWPRMKFESAASLSVQALEHDSLSSPGKQETRDSSPITKRQENINNKTKRSIVLSPSKESLRMVLENRFNLESDFECNTENSDYDVNSNNDDNEFFEYGNISSLRYLAKTENYDFNDNIFDKKLSRTNSTYSLPSENEDSGEDKEKEVVTCDANPVSKLENSDKGTYKLFSESIPQDFESFQTRLSPGNYVSSLVNNDPTKAPRRCKPFNAEIENTPSPVASEDLEGYYVSGKGPSTPFLEDLVMLYGLGSPIPKESVSPTMETKAAKRTRELIRRRLGTQGMNKSEKKNELKAFLQSVPKPKNEPSTNTSTFCEKLNDMQCQDPPNKITIGTAENSQLASPLLKPATGSRLSQAPKFECSKIVVSSRSPSSNINNSTRKRKIVSGNTTKENKNNHADKKLRCKESTDKSPQSILIIISSPSHDGISRLDSSNTNPFRNHLDNSIDSKSSEQPFGTHYKLSKTSPADSTIAFRTKSYRAKQMTSDSAIIPLSAEPSPVAFDNSPRLPKTNKQEKPIKLLANSKNISKIAQPQLCHNLGSSIKHSSKEKIDGSPTIFDNHSTIIDHGQLSCEKPSTTFSSPCRTTTTSPVLTDTFDFDQKNDTELLSNALKQINSLKQENNKLRNNSVKMKTWAEKVTHRAGSIHIKLNKIMKIMRSINIEHLALASELQNISPFNEKSCLLDLMNKSTFQGENLHQHDSDSYTLDKSEHAKIIESNSQCLLGAFQTLSDINVPSPLPDSSRGFCHYDDIDGSQNELFDDNLENEPISEDESL